MRGLACVLMFQTHCYDSWLNPEARKTTFFMWSQLGRPLPAPLFLFLAGISFALEALGRARDLRQRPGERVDHVTEAAGLRPRLAFGRDERDAEGLGHRLMVTTGAGRLAVRKVRRVH